MTPVEGMGVPIEFAPGPVIANPLRHAAQVEALRVPDPEESVPFVLETVREVCRPRSLRTCRSSGFCRAPFTLFCYLVEGHGSKTFTTAKGFLVCGAGCIKTASREAGRYDDCVSHCASGGRREGPHGVRLVGWIAEFGRLPPLRASGGAACHRRPAIHRCPLIYFPNQGAMLLEDVATLGADVVGIDWRIPLSKARSILGNGTAVQGNLDPAALFAPPEELKNQIDIVLTEAGERARPTFSIWGTVSNERPILTRWRAGGPCARENRAIGRRRSLSYR